MYVHNVILEKYVWKKRQIPSNHLYSDQCNIAAYLLATDKKMKLYSDKKTDEKEIKLKETDSG